MSQYRKVFKEFYGIEFSRDYEIHHIDCNHKNDDIENLMLLPKKLHRRYHMALSSCGPMIDDGALTMNVLIGSNLRTAYETDAACRLIKALWECSRWSFYKEVGYRNCDGSKMRFE